MELWGLIHGIQVASHMGISQLIIEGDSHIIISMATQIIHGLDVVKASPSWHLLYPLTLLNTLLHFGLNLIPSHVRREANRIADKLTNEGVSLSGEDLCFKASHSPTLAILKQCQELAILDCTTPNGMTSVQPCNLS